MGLMETCLVWGDCPRPGCGMKNESDKKKKIEIDSCTKEAWAIYGEGRNANTIACKFLISTFSCIDNSVPKE